MSFFSRIFSKEKKEDLDKGLEKTKQSFFSRIAKAIVGKSTVDAEVLDNLEEILVSSDVGVETTLKIIARIEARIAKDKFITTTSSDLAPNLPKTANAWADSKAGMIPSNLEHSTAPSKASSSVIS
jgi:signal recognition particle GTPase